MYTVQTRQPADTWSPQLNPEIKKRQVLVKPQLVISQTFVRTGTVPDLGMLLTLLLYSRKTTSMSLVITIQSVSLYRLHVARVFHQIFPCLVHESEQILLNKKQISFSAGLSTMLQLLKVLDKWTEILDGGRCVDVIYCDFKKAFYFAVSHRRFMSIPEYYGIWGPVLSWIGDFLYKDVEGVGRMWLAVFLRALSSDPYSLSVMAVSSKLIWSLFHEMTSLVTFTIILIHHFNDVIY